jgi:tripartite-type tricarboxylate transporter receptor subunit TctC
MSTRMALGVVFSVALTLQASNDYPTKPVRVIEPFGAGGGPDLTGSSVTPIECPSVRPTWRYSS